MTALSVGREVGKRSRTVGSTLDFMYIIAGNSSKSAASVWPCQTIYFVSLALSNADRWSSIDEHMCLG